MTNGRPHSDLRPEPRVLLACARRSMDAPGIEATAHLLGGPVDWSRLLALCVRHAILPLVERQLRAHFAALVPAEARERFGRAARAALGQSLMLTEELRRVMGAFGAAGVRALAYKGPALALQVHGEITLRTFRDLDLLVTRGDFFRARDVLLSLGYRPSPAITGAQEEALLRSECDQTLVSDASGALIELHWAVTPPHFSFPLETEALLARAVSIDLAGTAVAAPSREDLLLLLAMNGAKDLWLRLEPACLLAALVAGPLDWDRALATARGVRGERILLLGLALAADLLDAPLPPAIARRRATDPALEGLVTQARAHLLDDARPAPGMAAIARFRMRTRERWGDRAQYLLRWLMTPTRDDCARLPRRLWPVGYAIRPLRLLARSVAP